MLLCQNIPETAPDDATLARRIAQTAPGIDSTAEAELCRRMAPRVRLYGLKHLRNESAAADLVQQVLLTTLERLRAGRLREPEQIASYVLGMCRMVVLDLRRGHVRRERLLEAYGEGLAPVDAPEPLAFDSARLRRCLERLSVRECTVLIMSFYDDMPSEEVGNELGLTAANIPVIIATAGSSGCADCVTGRDYHDSVNVLSARRSGNAQRVLAG
jgi:RNA polymerase sigma-70 factor (ECF subfamily)